MFSLLLQSLTPIDLNPGLSKTFDFSIALGWLVVSNAVYITLLVLLYKSKVKQVRLKDEVITKLQEHLMSSALNAKDDVTDLKLSIRDTHSMIGVLSKAVDDGIKGLRDYWAMRDSFVNK